MGIVKILKNICIDVLKCYLANGLVAQLLL